jgi:hypothetical protein
MATWIGHLRIAESIYCQIPDLDETAFTFGNIAPDSGIPNADWTHFDPPKEVSHFLASGEKGEMGVEDLAFYRVYLDHSSVQKDGTLYSFLLGFYIHLLCDRLAMIKVGLPSLEAYADLFAQNSEVEGWDLIKNDWYGLDQLYVRDHPRCLFWRVFLTAPVPPSPLPFVRQEAFEHQIGYIREFYSHPSTEWVLDRRYPYLSKASMDFFVDQSSSLVLKVLERLKTGPELAGRHSGLEFLQEEDLLPLPPPMGDPPLPDRDQ